MKKIDQEKPLPHNDDALPEYDFTGRKGVRGKYYRAYRKGHTARIYQDGALKVHYDFSTAERGKFYRADAEFQIPVYLEPDINDFLTELAAKRKIAVQDLVNELLRSDMQIIRGAGN